MADLVDESGHPRFIYGTAWKEEETERLTRLAIESGFRAIDTANQRKHYVEDAVGAAIASALDDGLLQREELFVQTKFTYAAGQDHRIPYDPDAPYRRQVETSFQSSLNHLQLETIDSYVLHGPSTRNGLADADREVWSALEALDASGQVDHIGISNVSAGQLELLVDEADIAPDFVQNRCFARTGWDRRVRQICAKHDISYQGFSLLTANRRALKAPKVAQVAERYDRTIPQIVFRFALQIGILPLTGTTSQEHMNQDLAVFDFALDDGDVETVESIARP